MRVLLPFERTVESTIYKHHLLQQGDRVVAALSGGPDSTAMVAALAALGSMWEWELLGVHLNYGLRGKDSEDDAAFVRRLGEVLNIEVHVMSVPVSKRAAQKAKRSLQDYARFLRYTALEEVAMDRGAHKIAVGHTADDQAETVVMRMLRGAGVGGLRGIPPVRGRTVVRPLLEVTRRDVLAYLRDRGLGYRVDASNHEPLYLRNRIRHSVLPILKEYNPNLVHVLSRQADILREDDAYLEALAREAWHRMARQSSGSSVVLDRQEFLASPLPLRRRILRMVIQQVAHLPYGPAFGPVEALMTQVVSGPSGSMMRVEGVLVRREYEALQFEPCSETRGDWRMESLAAQEVRIPSRLQWPGTGETLTVSIASPAPPWEASNRRKVWFDRATFSEPLVIRAWRPGDYFCPFGMQGKRKKLQDFFSDAKIASSERHRIPLLVAPEGILWVGGYRMDHRFRVTEMTRDVLIAELTREAS
ncbi:MAG: tRNA lysidine(34) synthetase TilS [Nitrospirae bacterium]|nr:MAG: tRNA lysidine(34) synthetase TilS [Nitrospirota bacterium]